MRLTGSRVWFSGDRGKEEEEGQNGAPPQVEQSAEARGARSGWIKASRPNETSAWEWEIDSPGETISTLLSEEAFVA